MVFSKKVFSYIDQYWAKTEIQKPHPKKQAFQLVHRDETITASPSVIKGRFWTCLKFFPT